MHLPDTTDDLFKHPITQIGFSLNDIYDNMDWFTDKLITPNTSYVPHALIKDIDTPDSKYTISNRAIDPFKKQLLTPGAILRAGDRVVYANRSNTITNSIILKKKQTNEHILDKFINALAHERINIRRREGFPFKRTVQAETFLQKKYRTKLLTGQYDNKITKLEIEIDDCIDRYLNNIIDVSVVPGYLLLSIYPDYRVFLWTEEQETKIEEKGDQICRLY